MFPDAVEDVPLILLSGALNLPAVLQDGINSSELCENLSTLSVPLNNVANTPLTEWMPGQLISEDACVFSDR